MNFINATRLRAQYTLGLDPDGRERIVVVVKGTYDIPTRGGEAQLSDAQEPFVFADQYVGEPGLSAVKLESEFAPFKPMCDVVLNGSAYAPSRQAKRSVTVGLTVSTIAKRFDVLGNRRWARALSGGVKPGDPEPFLSVPLGYDVAFGGCEPSRKHQGLVNAYADNPVGVGYFLDSSASDIAGKPMPNTQELDRPVDSPKGAYRPMSLSALGRNFATRARYAGTYDETWLNEYFPFLPPDFDPRYFQCAPHDQQIAHPQGGELVELLNLTAQPILPFRLPTATLPVEFSPRAGPRVEQNAVMDTIVLEPDQMRMQILWRTSLPLRRNILELKQLVVGRMSKAWYRARRLGKIYYPSLAHLTPRRTNG